MTMKLFPLFLVMISTHGFLLDKTQSSSGHSVTKSQDVTPSEFLAETKARHQGDEQLRQYVDKSFALLTSQLEHKFNFLEQKLKRCENQSIPSQAYESLEQKFMDLELKYVLLEREYTNLQSVNKEFNLMKSQLVSVQNKTSEMSNELISLEQLRNIKPLQEIKSLQHAVNTLSVETHSLTVNERARSQDFLALYNISMQHKTVLGVLNINSSNQLIKLEELETNIYKQLGKIKQSQNSTAGDIMRRIQAIEQHDNITLSMMQKQISKNSERVAITANPSSSGTISRTIMQFDSVMFSVGITNLTSYKNTGKFTCETEGLYLISASVMSSTSDASYYIVINGGFLSITTIGHHDKDHRAFTGTVTITKELDLNDEVWLYTQGTWFMYGTSWSKLTIIKIK